jgi:hypothetical protein
MGDVYFTTNPTEWTRLPGLYISERNPVAFITGADLSTVGMATRCVRGPTTPLTITSVAQFLEIYGGRDYGSGGTLIGQGWAALANKPFGTLVIRRVAAADGVKGTLNLSNVTPTAIARVDASSLGLWGADVEVEVTDATDGDATHWNLVVTYLGETVTLQNLDTSTGVDNLAVTVGDDPGRLIDITKLADGRPLNSGPTALGSAAEGTLVVGDYTAGMNDIAVYPGVAVCLTPEASAGSAATFNGNLVTLASTVADRMFLTWSQVHGQSRSTEVTAVAAQITTTSDRIVWCYNSTYTVDPETTTEFAQAPHVWLASIMSQNDVDEHPGAAVCAKQTAGVKRMANTSLSRGDLIALREAGISTLERIADRRNRSSMFLFRDAVTTDLTDGKTEITRRRMADFLQLSASDRLRAFVKAKGTRVNRALMAGEITAFSEDLMDQERIVENFSIEQEAVNTKAQRARGLEKLLWSVELVKHMLYIVLETDIGTGVTIERRAAA